MDQFHDLGGFDDFIFDLGRRRLNLEEKFAIH